MFGRKMISHKNFILITSAASVVERYPAGASRVDGNILRVAGLDIVEGTNRMSSVRG